MTITLLIISTFLAFFVWAYRHDKRNREEAESKFFADNSKWLSDEQAKPRYRIKLFVKVGASSHEYESTYFEPVLEVICSHYLIVSKRTSLEIAQDVVEKTFELGRYRVDNTYIPMPEIEYIKVVE